MIEGNKQELSEEEKALCERVLAEWADKGKLTFRRIPNIITVIAALITASCFMVGAVKTLHSENPAPYVLFAISMVPLAYVLKELGRSRRGNEIVLTPLAFTEKRIGIFGTRQQIGIPWDRVKASEASVSEAGFIMPIFSFLFSTDEKLTIMDKSSDKIYTYRPRTIRHYNNFRAALITRVGLAVERESWHYE